MGKAAAKQNEKSSSDFESMRARKKLERAKTRHTGRTLTEEEILNVLRSMKHAAVEDRQLHQAGQLPVKKILLLKQFAVLLKKRELQHVFLEQGLLVVLSLWLKPLQEGHLPLLQIRETFLKLLLHEYTCIQKQHLLNSGLGKIVLQLSSHPEETTANRLRAKMLVHRWARDVYNIKTDYRELSSKDRVKLDMERMSGTASVDGRKPTKNQTTAAGLTSNRIFDEVALFQETKLYDSSPAGTNSIVRARVPMPSAKVYLNRPSSNISTQHTVGSDKLAKCERILDRFLKKKNRK